MTVKKALETFDRLAFDYAREPVPEDQTRSTWDVFAVWAAGFICVPMMMAGVAIAQAIPFWDALLAMLVGESIVAVLVVIGGFIGLKHRIPAAMLLKNVFGRTGASIPAVFIALSLLGWFAVQAEVFGAGLASMLSVLFGWKIPVPFLTLFGGMVMSTTAILGYKAVSLLSRLTLPLLVLLLVAPLFTLLMAGDSMENAVMPWDYEPQAPLSFGTVVSMLVGAMILGAMVAPDFNRYSRSRGSVILSNSGVPLVVTPFVMILAMFMVALSGKTEFVDIMYAAGWGLPALAILMFATWTTNDTNLYIASLSLSSLVTKFRKWQIAAIAGFAATLIAMAGIVQYFVPWMLMLGITFAPAAGVYMVDYYLGRRVYETRNFDTLPRWRVRPFISWGAGTLTGFLTTPAAGGGFGLFSVSQVPALDALCAAALVHAVLLVGSGCLKQKSATP